MQIVTVRTEGLILDAILAAAFGAVTARAMLTPTLILNPGLADLGPILPLGTVIALPDAPSRTSATRAVVDLFG